MRDDSSVERFLGNDNDKNGFHFGVIIATYNFSRKSLPKFPKGKFAKKLSGNSDFKVFEGRLSAMISTSQIWIVFPDKLTMVNFP